MQNVFYSGKLHVVGCNYSNYVIMHVSNSLRHLTTLLFRIPNITQRRLSNQCIFSQIKAKMGRKGPRKVAQRVSNDTQDTGKPNTAKGEDNSSINRKIKNGPNRKTRSSDERRDDENAKKENSSESSENKEGKTNEKELLKDVSIKKGGGLDDKQQDNQEDGEIRDGEDLEGSGEEDLDKSSHKSIHSGRKRLKSIERVSRSRSRSKSQRRNVRKNLNFDSDHYESSSVDSEDSGSSDGESLDSEADSEIDMSFRARDEEFSTESEDEERDRAKIKKQKRMEHKPRSRARRDEVPKGKRKRKDYSKSRSRRSSRSAEVDNRRKYRKRTDEMAEDQIARIVKMVKAELSEGRSKGSKGKEVKITSPRSVPQVKSPSESAIYIPALTKNLVGRKQVINDNRSKQDLDIIKYIKNIRLDDRKRRRTRSRSGSARSQNKHRRSRTRLRSRSRNRHSRSRSRTEHRERGARKEPELSGRELAEEAIVEAEKYRAMILPNQGKDNDILPDDFKSPVNIPRLPALDDDDDDFFFTTCHVDQQLVAKIRRGMYVELEKLLAKPRIFKMEEDKLNLINKNGEAKFVQSNETPRITNVRRWEQAFRIYATIYSEANPNRSAEILQHIGVINRAASKYTWDSVAYYDHTFRRLMERKPYRSWSKTYTQIWNLAMTEPLSLYKGGAAGGDH